MPKHIKNSLAVNKYLLFRIALYVYTVLLFIATLLPAKLISGGGSGWFSFLRFQHSDKLIHFLMFFLMTVLLFRSYKLKKYWYFTIPILTGLLIEILQHYVPTGRTFDVLDLVANSIGALAAYFLIRNLYGSFSQRDV